MHRDWYRESPNTALSFFKVTPERGLTESRVIERRHKFGSNILSREERRSTVEIFIDQIKNPLIYVLLIASIIVIFLGDFLEAAVILAIVLINSVIGTFQEGKAEDTLAALNRIVKSYVLVIRDGRQQKIPDYELVPGDILILKDGEAIGADARIIHSNSLRVNESSLTGESGVVEKIAEPINAVGITTADQVNMVFRGTYVVSGLAKAVVVKTGTKTIIGSISKKLSDLHMDVPLKRNIHDLSKVIVYIVLAAAIFIFFMGLRADYSWLHMFTIVVAVSVSAIPESLPVIVTLVLATGVWRMSKQNVLVKKLQAVEALGQAKVIALDKTGTITKNQMVVERIFINGDYLTITGLGYEPKGVILSGHKKLDVKDVPGLSMFLKTSALTSIAEVTINNTDGEWVLNYGDPTEAALIVLARKFGYDKVDLLKDSPQILEIPFDMHNQHHTTVNEIRGKNVMMVVGGPEVVLKQCNSILFKGKTRKISKADKDSINSALSKLSSDGYRVLALAINSTPPTEINPKKLPNLTFVGFSGITDAIRPEVKDSVQSVRAAGIKVLMITGDHIETATAIATKVGIFKPGDKVLSGTDMVEISDADLPRKIEGVTVFARVTPNDKLRVIEAYKRRGETIAMTGDGVNDALSLVAADLGVAMGKIGTEVAREASDIVLLDDQFGNIVSAAEEGRNIYFTIRKSILFLLSTNLGELLLIILAVTVGIPLPLTAVQIIWLNLVTDTFLVGALALDPKEKNLLKEKFNKPSKYIVDWFMGSRIIIVSVLMSFVTLWLFMQYMEISMVKALTISLTILTVFNWYNIFNVRSDKDSIFSRTPFDNKYIILGLLIAVIMHLFAIYNPFMQQILNTTGLGIGEWVVVLVAGLSIVIVEELRKIVYRIYLSRKMS